MSDWEAIEVRLPSDAIEFTTDTAKKMDISFDEMLNIFASTGAKIFVGMVTGTVTVESEEARTIRPRRTPSPRRSR